MSEQNKFQIGDTVIWTSQAGGKSKTKTGEVIAIVPKLQRMGYSIPDGFRFNGWDVATRSHESYLVQVGKSKRLYWPLVKYLEKVQVIENGKDVYNSGISPLEQYKRETEPWNVDTEDDDPMLPGEGCGYDAVDVGDGSNPDL